MPTPIRVLVGSLSPGLLPTASAPGPPEGTVLLDLGPDHPSRAGVLELRLWTSGGVVTSAEVVVGAMHRGVEKLFEVRDYRQILMLADRHDWQAPVAGELAVAAACEQLLSLEVPGRAVWMRTLLAEHTRLLSHLGFLAYVPFRLGLPSPTAAVREQLRSATQRLTGNRIHPMAVRLGGLSVDADDDWLDDELVVLDHVATAAVALAQMMSDPVFEEASTGVAPLSAELVEAFGVSGPAARASGVALDLRRTAPYLAYDELQTLLSPGSSPTGSSASGPGDARVRFTQLVSEVLTSVRLVAACVERLRTEPGPVSVPLPKVVLVPEGSAYEATEAPLGMNGCYLVSRGDKTPWRLKLRTPSFNNVAALEALLPGVAVGSLEMALASMGYVLGDVDK